MLELRDYQVDLIHRMREAMSHGERRLLCTAPTGSGKTVMISHMLDAAAKRGKKSWLIVHRRELIDQTLRTVESVGTQSVGVVAAGYETKSSASIQICSIQTLIRRISNLELPQLIVWDECHHIAASSWSDVFAQCDRSYHIGLTATPCRLDGRGLKEWFHRILCGPSVSELIQRGFLSRYRLFAPCVFDTSGLKTRLGDWIKGDLSARVDRPSITGSAIAEYQKRCPGQNALVFCVDIAHSEHTAKQFQEAGINAVAISSKSDVQFRDREIEAFRRETGRVICNCDLFGEGVDVPGIVCAILLRPTQSTGLYLQQVGRALRPAQGKPEAIVLDHVGNSTRHGLPDDDRVWSLEGLERRRKGSARDEHSVRICQYCFAANPLSGGNVCSCCGELLTVERDITHVDGELTEIDIEKERRTRKQEQAGAETYADLVALGTRRGYKNPRGWAWFITNSRHSRRQHDSYDR